MTMSPELAAHLPEWLRRRMSARPSAPLAPEAELLPCALLFADISGFTPLMERLSQHGLQGVEELSRTMNGYFDRLLRELAAHGGEVARFAGDAALVLWPAGDASREALAEATRRAARCGLRVQELLHAYPVSEGLTLSLRLGLGTGRMHALIVGGEDRWEYLVLGAPMQQAAAAQQVAHPGELVASRASWAHLEGSFDGVVRSSGDVRLLSCRAAPPPRAALLPELAPGAETALRPFVSRTLRALFEVPHSAWRAELRRVTVLFLELHGLAEPTSPALLAQLQTVTLELQKAVYAFGGSINQLLADDKGTVLLAAWGLPTSSHEDNAARAVRAALQAQTALEPLGLSASVGITTGHVFCGDRGGVSRREYALAGRVVNLAARLMQAAHGGLLCDETTAREASPRIGFEPLESLTLKGVDKPVPVLRPVREQRRPEQPAAITGREAERAVLDEALRQLPSGRGGAVVLEGEAGIGKSSLVRYFQGQAQDHYVFHAATDAVESTTLYYAWRTLFADLLGCAHAPSASARRSLLLERFAGDERLLSLAPLLNPVLRLDLPDTELTAQLKDEARADTTQGLLLELLARELHHPSVFILEDVHWLDSASWELTRRLLREHPQHLLLLSTRPDPDDSSSPLKSILRMPSARHLRLQPMPARDISRLICSRLGATRLSAPLESFIHERAEGHPFFTEELVYVLRDQGLLVIEAGECRFSEWAITSGPLSIPSTLEGLITSRIDRLSPTEQLTIKAASVIGRAFHPETLRDIHPIEDARASLDAQLEHLGRLDLMVRPPAPREDTSYLFKHVITQQVVYNLLLFEQRRQLHEAVARWYERTYADDLSAHYALLAHHWLNAGASAKAIDMLEKAGEQAFQTNAFHEALGFFSKALELDAQSGHPVEPLRRARWERQFGTVQSRLGHLYEAQDALWRSLTRLGFSPTTARGFRVDVLREVLRQLLHLLLPPRLRLGRARDEPRLLEAALTCLELSTLSYWSGEEQRLAYLMLRSINLAERVPPSGVLARAYASLVLALGHLGMHRLARRYQKSAAELSARLTSVQERAHVQRAIAAYLLSTGQFARAEATLDICLSDFRQLGDTRLAQEEMFEIFNLSFLQGRLDSALALAHELLALARRREDRQTENWALVGLSRMLLKFGREREVLELLKGHETPQDILGGIPLLAVLALARLRVGLLAEARAAAEQGVTLLSQRSSNALNADAYTNIVTVLTTLWTQAREGAPERAHLERLTKRVCERVSKVGQVFQLAAPAASLCQGKYQLARSRRRAARKAFEKALRIAQKLGMPFEQLEAHEALYLLGEADRMWHLEQARRLQPAPPAEAVRKGWVA
ncbi:AAA family ATPase [Cystobacter fuscus]|uniref:AAA family ATPase n=1 Tax=Cystobacter fuscus TaxID=43 RepID=UPI0037BE8BD5